MTRHKRTLKAVVPVMLFLLTAAFTPVQTAFEPTPEEAAYIAGAPVLKAVSLEGGRPCNTPTERARSGAFRSGFSKKSPP